MLGVLIVEHLWAAILLVSLLLFLDYRLSIIGLRWFRKGAHEHYDLGGSYELNPTFEDDIEGERLVSPRLLLAMARSIVIVSAAWWFTARVGSLEDVYAGVLGFFVLIQVPVTIRHLNNIALFRYVVLQGGFEGRMRAPRWIDLKMSGWLLWLFAGAFGALWLLSGDALFVGGTVGCLLAGLRYWLLADEAKPSQDEKAKASPAD